MQDCSNQIVLGEQREERTRRPLWVDSKERVLRCQQKTSFCGGSQPGNAEKKLSLRVRGKPARSVLKLIAQIPLEEQLGGGSSCMSRVWCREGNGNFLTLVCEASSVEGISAIIGGKKG